MQDSHVTERLVVHLVHVTERFVVLLVHVTERFVVHLMHLTKRFVVHLTHLLSHTGDFLSDCRKFNPQFLAKLHDLQLDACHPSGAAESMPQVATTVASSTETVQSLMRRVWL